MIKKEISTLNGLQDDKCLCVYLTFTLRSGDGKSFRRWADETRQNTFLLQISRNASKAGLCPVWTFDHILSVT